jgi:hypothetical protein
MVAWITTDGRPSYHLAVCTRPPGHTGPHVDQGLDAYAWDGPDAEVTP